MAEYIDRENVYKRACRGCTRHGDEIMSCNMDGPCEELEAEFSSAPAADVAPVRHGRPISKERNETLAKFERVYIPTVGGEFYQKIYEDVKVPVDYCPECRKRLCSRFANYCPNCGAKMDKEG